ncbi:MAG: 5'-3' exonuclease [Thermoleophilaceae bacterium]
MSAPLLAVDAPSLLYRAFFALPKTIVEGEGVPVNALLGSLNIVLRVVAEQGPRAVVFCFGPDAAGYRVELYPAYHAARPEVPEELAPQFAAAPAFFEAFGWFVETHDSLEADDLLGSLAAEEAEAGGEALILTGDRDLYQCVDERVRVLYMKTGSKGPELVDAAEVRKRYGVAPALVPDFIALRGDPSDGLPGGTGIGDKTASALLERHGSLEGAIAGAMGERSARVRGALLDEAEQLRDFREIARLRRTEVARPPDRGTDFAGGAEAARARGMNRLAERLEG